MPLFTSGIQYPLHYHYNYRAKISGSVPEVNSKHVEASDIRMDVKVYSVDQTKMIFQVSMGTKDCICTLHK